MEEIQQAYNEIKALKDGEHHYFNMFHHGVGAVVYKCNEMYLLYELPMHGAERYEGKYFEHQIKEFVDLVFSWT